MKELFAIIAALLGIAGNVPYVRDIFTGRVKPHAYTWLVWSLVSGITFFGQVAKGAGIGALPTAVSEIFTIAIFLLSLRYGFQKVSRTDTYFLILALFGIALWLITDEPTYSVVIAVSIDVIAFIPTLRKARQHPETETPLLYGSNVVRHLFALASLQTYNVATMLHSLAMIVMNSAMVTQLMIAIERAKK